MRRILFGLLILLVSAACSVAVPADAPSSRPTARSGAPASPETSPAPGPDMARVDQQGSVVVEITPLNLAAAGDTLEFSVALNTHSVDLSMDLATLATLTTDAGITVAATEWDAPGGGHHVSGKLIFPAAAAGGKGLLEGTTTLTLAIVNLDAPLREFIWKLK